MALMKTSCFKNFENVLRKLARIKPFITLNNGLDLVLQKRTYQTNISLEVRESYRKALSQSISDNSFWNLAIENDPSRQKT